MKKSIINQINTINRHTSTESSNFRCVYIIRHGECKSNVTWPIENYSDAMDVLTPLGRKQALASADLLSFILNSWQRNISDAKMYSSTLTRAKETSDIIHGRLGFTTPIIYDHRLIEHGGENEGTRKFSNRVSAVFNDLSSTDHDCIVVCHGHTMQAILALCLNTRHDKIDVSVNNGGICIFNGRSLIHWNLIPQNTKGFGL
jgi:broad specificity phosphatase PhoE